MKHSNNTTRAKLIQDATVLLAELGYDGTSMRKLAERTGVKQPVIYYHFANKAELLSESFRAAQRELGRQIAQLPEAPDAAAMLRQRVAFTWRNGHLVMALLNYFVGHKHEPSVAPVRIPPQAYRHLQEVIERGIAEGVYASNEPGRDAGIMLHALNGFALEHFPAQADQIDPELLQDVCNFFERALRPPA